MSTPFSGDPSLVSNALSRTVTGATNASPIVITTSVAHLFYDGDTVSNSGITGNTAANGVFVITVLSSTTFSLNGSTGNGAYVSGGTSVDVSLTPGYTIPSDADALDAASVNVALEVMGDRTQFLNRQAVTQASVWSSSSAPTYTAQKTGLYELVCLGAGGGGGGGNAGGPGLEAGGSGSGGGAGGIGRRRVALTAGDVLTIAYGTAGAAGVGAVYGVSAPTDGSDGGDTTISDDNPTVLCRGLGGSGGEYGEAYGAGASSYVRGGTFCKNPMYVGTQYIPLASLLNAVCGQGGYGRRVPRASQVAAEEPVQAGGNSSCVFGGTYGLNGAKLTGAAGSGGGGGGASDWPTAVPGVGGVGGDGAILVGDPGSDGGDGTAGTLGCGGGGGGGGGGGSMGSDGGDGGDAGAGGGAFVEIVYLGPIS